jgi:DNA-binding beta-propeller fold protein YncE
MMTLSCMMTRRTLLRLAGSAAGATALAAGTAAATTACSGGSDPKSAKSVKADGDLLLVELSGGLAVVAAAGGQRIVPPSVAVTSLDRSTLVRAKAGGAETQVIAQSVATGRVVSSGTLRGRLEPRVASPNGRLVALAPADTPVGRSRTTLVVADSSGERVRLELPGNLEPEAFSVDGAKLFVLDYLPPTAPEGYRVRAIDLASKEVQPLVTRVKSAVPPGAEETMRGEGRQAVYAPGQRMLFTLYTHQPDHLHTRDLLAGARADAPHVHAFVHSLSLAEGWAYCIDLPSPFGEHAASGHTIALSPDETRLVVLNAPGGAAAVIDAAALTVQRVINFGALAGAPTGGGGEAVAAVSADGGRLIAAAGREGVTVPLTGSTPASRWSVDGPVRGLALSKDGGTVYVGQKDQIIRRDVNGGRTAGQTEVDGLVRLRQRVPS